MKIITTVWANGGNGSVGLVVTENSVGERKIRAGVASGLDEEFDARKIAELGGEISVEILEKLISTAKGET